MGQREPYYEGLHIIDRCFMCHAMPWKLMHLFLLVVKTQKLDKGMRSNHWKQRLSHSEFAFWWTYSTHIVTRIKPTVFNIKNICLRKMF